MKQRWPLLVSILIAGAFVFAIVHRHQGSGGNKFENPVRIGVVLSLTGDAANYGRRSLNGITWAVEQINAQGGINGRTIEIHVEDTRSESKDAVLAITKLITVDHITVIVGDVLSATTLAMAPIAESNHVLLFAPGASNPSLRDAGDFIFRDWTSDDYDGKAMAGYLLKQNVKSVGMLVQRSDYTIGVANALAKAFQSQDGRIIDREEFETSETNFRTQLERLKSKGVASLYMAGLSQETGVALKQAAEIGYSPQWFTTLTVDTPECAKIAGAARNGVIFTTPAFDATSTDPAMVRFVHGFKERFGDEPEAVAGHGYDAIDILASVLATSGTDATRVKTALYSVRDFPGVTGTMTFDDHGDVLKY